MKIHLVCSDEPLTFGGTVKGICGAEVLHSTLAFMWDDLAVGAGNLLQLVPKGTCLKCAAGELSGRYLYGIRPAQEALDAETL